MKIKPSLMVTVGGLLVAIGSIVANGFTGPSLPSYGAGGIIVIVGWWVGVIGVFKIGRYKTLLRVSAGALLLGIVFQIANVNGQIAWGLCFAIYGMGTFLKERKNVNHS